MSFPTPRLCGPNPPEIPTENAKCFWSCWICCQDFRRLMLEDEWVASKLRSACEEQLKQVEWSDGTWQSGMKNEMHQNLMISGDLFCTTSFLLCFSVFTHHLLKGDLSQNFSSQTS